MQGRWGVTRIGFLIGLLLRSPEFAAWRIRRFTPENLASLDRYARPDTGGETLAGWQLEHRPPAEIVSTQPQGFAAMASARAGERLAHDRARTRAASRSAFAKRPGMLCGSIFVTAALAAIMPGVAWNQWQRFLFPSRDVPPYTGVTIELKPAEAERSCTARTSRFKRRSRPAAPISWSSSRSRPTAKSTCCRCSSNDRANGRPC